MTVQFVAAILSTFYYVFVVCATSALVCAAIVDFRHSNNKKVQFSECKKENDNDSDDEECCKNVENVAKNNYF